MERTEKLQPTTVRLNRGTYERLERIADQERVSLAAAIRVLLERGLYESESGYNSPSGATWKQFEDYCAFAFEREYAR